ncbi:RsmF rRNA methyltransferase first C-terminal domain-containing protein [Fructilactobacillus sanfranciscensis]|uniref:RsmF rRNA methyltransferase first C-terminal domain-containing protein n=1 Tax=Fructilactobacillus sanfranciscensis TaxID=1625 RepID=UPI0013D345A8|nr:NOL1/NOP2/sun family putative RNA methylase [Fructilactobacillus sanfranciscensis]
MELPEKFKSKYKRLLGEEYENFIKSFDEEADHGFRINRLKPKANLQINTKEPIEYVDNGFIGKIDGKSAEHQSGYIYSQEPSAMFVAQVADPKPGEKILDLCAAPGGKSTQLASLMNNQGLLVSNEIDRGRAKILVENIERFGVKNPLILNEDPANLSKHFKKYFDKILIDAPCSGEGMFRKNHDATNYWSEDYPKECATLQREIVKKAVKMLKPGGQIIYSTCTFAPEEDEQIIAWLVDNYNFKILPIEKFKGMSSGRPAWANGNPDLSKTVRLFPHLFRGDGHFVAKLQSLDDGKIGKIKYQRSNVSGNLKKDWEKFNYDNFVNFDPHPLLKFGETLYSFNPEIPDLNGLKVMRPGTPLGQIKKNRIEPAYGLALEINPEHVKNKLNITRDEWKLYVHGDTIPTDSNLEKGWYLLICDGMSIGFGKVVSGTIKNFFPKGLRFKA